MKRIKWREVAESYPCEDCGAGPGDHCRTRNGNEAKTPHTVRTNLASSRRWRYADQIDKEQPAWQASSSESHP